MSPRTRGRVDTRATPRPRVRTGFAWLGIVAAVALLTASALAVAALQLARERDAARAEARRVEELRSSEREELATASRERAEALHALGELRVRSAALVGTIDVLSAPSTRSLELAPPAPAAAGSGAPASARAFITQHDGRLVLFCQGLPDLAPGQTYQVWLETEAEAVPAGVFRPVAGRARHEVVALPIADAPVRIAVTIEPEGGRPAPSGAAVLKGRESRAAQASGMN